MENPRFRRWCMTALPCLPVAPGNQDRPLSFLCHGVCTSDEMDALPEKKLSADRPRADARQVVVDREQ